jgi:hypothetical protein
MSAKYTARETNTDLSSENDDLLSLLEDGLNYSAADLSGSSCDSNDGHFYGGLVVLGWYDDKA